MAIIKNANNLLYQAYGQSGPTIALIGPALGLTIVGFIGAVMNAFVLLVTVRASTLRGSSNFLMALVALFECVHQLGHLAFLTIVASGLNFVDMQMATFILIPQIFALNANLLSMLAAAIDRLFAVASKERHSNIYVKHRKCYLAGHTLFITIYAAICTAFVPIYGSQHPEIPTTGYIGEILPLIGAKWYVTISVPLFGSILCYCLIGGIVRRNKSVTTKTNTHLLRSLVLILCVSVGAYILGIAAYQVLFNVPFGLGQIALWEWSFVPGIILNMGAAANAPILYVNSTEYRNAFKSQLKLFCPRLSRALKLHTQSSVQQLNNNSIQHNQQQQHLGKVAGINGGGRIGMRKISVWSTGN